MNELALFFGVLAVSFFSVYFYMKFNEKKRLAIGIDINKQDQREICEGTGISLLVPLWLGIAAIFLLQGFSFGLLGLGLLLSILSATGFVDDIKPKFVSKIISWKARSLPIGLACLGFAWFFSPSLYWIVLIALFVAAIASLQNTFAGLNGWTAGAGIIASTATAIALRNTVLFAPAIVLTATILGFLLWNKYPSRVLEGDSGTLLIGAGIAGLLVMSGSKTLMLFGLLLYLPNIVDFFVLKLLTNLKDVSQSKARPYLILEDGRISIPEGKKPKLDFAKLVLKVFGPLREWQIVLVIWIVCGLNALLWLKAFGFL